MISPVELFSLAARLDGEPAPAGKKMKKIKRKKSASSSQAAPAGEEAAGGDVANSKLYPTADDPPRQVSKAVPWETHKNTHYDRVLVDYVRTMTKNNVWYYRDRLCVPRGPCTLPVLKECWVQGVIDENTLVWGQGLVDWLPVKNVRTLIPQIRTLEVQLATWIKKQFGLKPALKAVREERAKQGKGISYQVDNMY